MGNGTRHLLGAIAGIVAIPVVVALVFGGFSLTMRAYAQFLTRGGELYVAVAVLVVGAIVLALLVGTRISPLASLIPGLVVTGIGALAVAAPGTINAFAHDLGSVRLSFGGLRLTVGQMVTDPVFTGAYALVGVLLIVASLAPSRWRAKAPAAAPGAHRAAPQQEEPWPPAPPVPSDPAQHRATPPLPADEPRTAPEYPYGSGPQSPYGGSGPQAPYGGSGPQSPYGSGEPQGHYGEPPYGGAGEEPQGPYRSAFEPPATQDPGGDPTGYAPGNRPSSWSGPQAPYPAEPGRPAQPAGADPYAAPVPPPPPSAPPSAFGQPAEPWGPPPDAGQTPPTRAFSTESAEAERADPTPRTLPDANANDATNRITWTESDQARLRDERDR